MDNRCPADYSGPENDAGSGDIMTDKIDNAFTAGALSGVTHEPTYAGALSFARRKYSKNLEEAELAITGVPFDTATTNRAGARFGPRAIRSASTEVAWQRNWPWEFAPFEVLKTVDYGDCYSTTAGPKRCRRPSKPTPEPFSTATYDHAEITALLGATLAYDLICLYAARHKLGERFSNAGRALPVVGKVNGKIRRERLSNHNGAQPPQGRVSGMIRAKVNKYPAAPTGVCLDSRPCSSQGPASPGPG